MTSGTSFITLLIAIILHQLFEGLAIGSAAVDAGLGALRCAALGVAYSVTTPLGIAIGAACTTRCNMTRHNTGCCFIKDPSMPSCLLLAIVCARGWTPTPLCIYAKGITTQNATSARVAPAGIGIRASFNANSTTTLLATGIMDCFSAGILLYVVLVQLLTPMFTDSDWVHGQRWPLQAASFIAFYAGTGVMAIIGKWA